MISCDTISRCLGTSAGSHIQENKKVRTPAEKYSDILSIQSSAFPKMQYDPTKDSMSARELYLEPRREAATLAASRLFLLIDINEKWAHSNPDKSRPFFSASSLIRMKLFLYCSGL